MVNLNVKSEFFKTLAVPHHNPAMGSSRTVKNVGGLGLGLESAETLSTGAVEAETEKYVPAI
jgi:hypothetical protein